MEAKQISLFCLLLAALAGKIETKPSGSLNSVGLTAEEAQLGSIRAASVGQSNVAQDHFSSSIGSAGSFGTGSLGSTGSFGTGNLGSTGNFGTGIGGAGLQRGFSSLGSTGNFGTGIGGAGLADRGCSNCGQGTYPTYAGIGNSGLDFGGIGCSQYPTSSIAGLGNNRFQNLPGCLGQQQYGSLFNCNPCDIGSQGISDLGISTLTGRYNDAGLDYLYSPCTSCNQVGTQDLGFNNILGNSRGCLSGSQGIPLGTSCGTYQQSLVPYTAGCNNFGLSCQQGITASASCGVCQGITGTTGSGYCQSCQSTPICDNTCDSTCTDAVVVVAVPVVEEDCDCGDSTVVTDPCLTC